MRQVTATEARKEFFKLLDAAARGETVVIERGGVPLRLVRGKLPKKKISVDYTKYFHSPVNDADLWTWEWHPSKGLKLIKPSK
ncbi:MAG: type II toxin-antitoxin system Phd/YefM family antitoxin [Deltaproteobacteria bacterium]|nr:type II toxin-antitoxin system Phd/YefM family antitoxin [Deltaproteobacteria bacterium]